MQAPTEQTLLAFFEAHQLPYQRIEHPAVFTCAESEQHRPAVTAVSTKNLFLRDKKGRRYFLAVTACEKTVDLKTLGEQLGAAKLHFASEPDLERLLGVTRGSVTMLGLINDTEQLVELWVDAEVWRGENFLCHPLVNTATLILSHATLERFLALSGHTPRLFG